MADEYKSLATVLLDALDQAQTGKGRERHAQGSTPFERQPICEIARMVGTGYCTGQAMKKAQEAMRLPNPRAQAELLGAINYLAAAVIVLREQAADAEPGSPKRRHMADKGEPMPRQSPHMGFPDLEDEEGPEILCFVDCGRSAPECVCRRPGLSPDDAQEGET